MDTYTSVLAVELSVELSVELFVEFSDTKFWYSCARSNNGLASTCCNVIVINDNANIINKNVMRDGHRSRCVAYDILKRQTLLKCTSHHFYTTGHLYSSLTLLRLIYANVFALRILELLISGCGNFPRLTEHEWYNCARKLHKKANTCYIKKRIIFFFNKKWRKIIWGTSYFKKSQCFCKKSLIF